MMDEIGSKVVDRHPKLVGGALAYVLERLTPSTGKAAMGLLDRIGSALGWLAGKITRPKGTPFEESIIKEQERETRKPPREKEKTDA